MRIGACLLTLALAGSLAAQEKSKWRRVYTYEDAVIEMEEINLSFGDFGRVRFRTVFDETRTLRGKPGAEYKTVVDDLEIMCAERQYRVTESVFLDSKGRAIQTYKAGASEPWKHARSSMMERLLYPACRMIANKKL